MVRSRGGFGQSRKRRRKGRVMIKCATGELRIMRVPRVMFLRRLVPHSWNEDESWLATTNWLKIKISFNKLVFLHIYLFILILYHERKYIFILRIV